MTPTLEAAQPDLRAVKQRQQQTWASGDYAAVASRIVLVAEQLCDTADLRAGWRVLDVATGSGNAAIVAARHGCTAVGIDYVPALLERGRERAAAEGLEVELLEGDAESLPFTDDSFDATGRMQRLRTRPRPEPRIQVGLAPPRTCVDSWQGRSP